MCTKPFLRWMEQQHSQMQGVDRLCAHHTAGAAVHVVSLKAPSVHDAQILGYKPPKVPSRVLDAGKTTVDLSAAVSQTAHLPGAQIYYGSMTADGSPVTVKAMVNVRECEVEESRYQK